MKINGEGTHYWHLNNCLRTLSDSGIEQNSEL